MTETTTDPEQETAGPLGTAEAEALSGASFRQIDYWARRGYVTPCSAVDGSKAQRELPDVDPVAPGSGRYRVWTPEEVEVIRRMVLFIEIGLSVEVAAAAARVEGPISLGHGIVLTAPWSTT